MTNKLEKILKIAGKTATILGLSALAVLGSEKSKLSEAFPEVMRNAIRIENAYTKANPYVAEYTDYLENNSIEYGQVNTDILMGIIGAGLGYALTRKRVKGGLN